MLAHHATATPTFDAPTIVGHQFGHLAQAWNRADGASFASGFAADAEFVDIRGAHHHGAIAVGEGHQAIFDTIYAGSSVAYRVEAAREIGPGCVVAVVAATLDAPTGPLRGINRSRITVVLTDEGDRWTIAAFHNTLAQE